MSLSKINLTNSMIEQVFANLPDFVYWKDNQQRYLWCNNNFAKFIGLKNHWEITGKLEHELSIDKAILQKITRDDKQVLEQEINLTRECAIQNNFQKENRKHLLIKKNPLYDDNKNISGILTIATDITEQSQFFENAESDSCSLKESHNDFNLDSIIAQMAGYVYWKNMKSVYMGCNDNLAQLSGLKNRYEIIGRTDYDFSWGKEQADSFVADDQCVMSKKEKVIAEYQLPIQREDGVHLIIRTEKMPLYDQRHEIIGILAIAVDITEQKILERKLIEEKEKSERLSQIKTEILRNLEHDLKTPFSGLYSLTKLIEEKESDLELKSFMHEIHMSSKELLDLFNGILDFTRVESGTEAILSMKFNLKELMTSIKLIENPAVIEKKLQFILEYPENMPMVFIGDPYRLRRIMMNLIGNAIKFTPAGYIKLSAVVAQKENERRCIIKLIVEDTGIGIPEEKQNYIYEKFSRLSASNKNKYKGAGLGLYIVKTLIEELEGEIAVKSVEGKGSIFTCTLPLNRPLLDDNLSN